MYRLRSGCLIWQQDVSQLRSVIRQLQKTAAELEEEGALLSQELKLRSEEAAVTEQNRIYNQLTAEVGPQLSLLRQLLQKRDAAPDREALFEKICLLGTYVKRRCSLRLIEQSDGTVACEDLGAEFSGANGAPCRDGRGCEARLERSAAPVGRFCACLPGCV
jgi:transposase-like protein